MDTACGTNQTEERLIEFWGLNLKKNKHLQEPSLDKRIILKEIQKKT